MNQTLSRMLANSLSPKLNSVNFRVAGLDCLPPVPKLGSFFVTPWPTSRTLVDVLDVRLDARKQCSTFKFWTFLISRGPRPLDLAAHTLNKGTERRTGTSSTYFSMWVGHTHLKILQTMPKTHPHQESFEKNGVASHSLPNHTVLSGCLAVRRPFFSECP